MLEDLISNNFNESMQAKKDALLALKTPIRNAIELIVHTFKSENKLLICGNGGSAADSQHFAAEFTGRYEIERQGLPAIALTTDASALTAIGNDYGFDYVFSKQVEAIAKPGDVLFAISTSGNSANVILAMEKAHKLGLKIIALVGKDGGKMSAMLKPEDINLCVPFFRTCRVQEIHILTIHTICDGVDQVMFKNLPI